MAIFVPTYFQQHFGIEASLASDLTSYYWLVFTFSVFVSGWLSDRLQVRKPVIAFGGVASGLCLLWAASRPVGTSYVALAFTWGLTGWFAGFIYPAWCALVSENAEAISPFGVARAFGIAGVLSVGSGLVFNLDPDQRPLLLRHRRARRLRQGPVATRSSSVRGRPIETG